MPDKKQRQLNLSEDNVLNAVNVFLDEGRKFHRLSNYKRAMRLYDVAVELDPESLAPLEHRAATLVKLAYFPEALEEIEKLEEALGAQGRPLPRSARRTQVEALWQQGEFERAAVLAARGIDPPRHSPYFTDMYFTSLATLEQCLGPAASDLLDRVLEQPELLDSLRPEPEDEVAPPRKQRPRAKNKAELCREQRYREFLRQRRLYRARVFLGALASDVEFIDNLGEHPALPSANRASEAWIRRHVNIIGDDVLKRVDLLAVECPLYAVEHRTAVRVSPELRARRAEDLEMRREHAREQAARAVLRVLALRPSDDPRLFTQALRAARKFFETTSRRELPDKAEYQALLYHLIGIAYLHFNLPEGGGPGGSEARARRLRDRVNTIMQTGEKGDLVMAGTTMPFFDYAGSLRLSEQRLKRASSRLERLCITFEMAHCCSKLRRWSDSLSYSRKALALAREAGHNVWGVVAAIELCKAELHLKVILEAKTSIREAIELAEPLEDECLLEMLHAIASALERVPGPGAGAGAGPGAGALYDEQAQALSPQKRILRLMADEALRSRCAEMFARINTLPPEYRLPLQAAWTRADQEREHDQAQQRPISAPTFFRESDTEA
ncbi:Small glutamine-rich tetratricopeptide repeat-containing protein beta [Frankliniella fusca]|uniref:Small glutamine-rich tetratricopeptide repeat-containing protein beta n=1 Tax=Frankliniella fusca TaxID=407009 RepID=A0AAE1I3B6_9NEOP|nr:Small glutamine-rich tetratricopeptide repeat-containing protein beta [Frankliniella fusca]